MELISVAVDLMVELETQSIRGFSGCQEQVVTDDRPNLKGVQQNLGSSYPHSSGEPIVLMQQYGVEIGHLCGETLKGGDKAV